VFYIMAGKGEGSTSGNGKLEESSYGISEIYPSEKGGVRMLEKGILGRELDGE
jgi:hypothetical protein